MENKTIGQLLKEWDVGETTIAAFEANEISVPDLVLLTDDDLKDLVPLIGPRNKIKRELSKMKTNGNKVLELSKDQEDISNEIVQEAQDNNSEIQSTPTVILNSETSVNEQRAEKQSTTSNVNDKPSQKKSKTSSSYSYDLNAVLEAAGGAGELILKSYKSQGALNDSNRSSLARIIINSETAGDFKKHVTTDRASFIATKIVETFPSELVSTWYRTEYRSDGKSKIVKGRLMRRFYSQRKAFKKLGVLTNKDSDTEEEENLDEDLTGDPDDETANSVNESYIWLTNGNISPWTRVLSAWKDTSKKRLKELQTPVALEESGEGLQGKRNHLKPKKVKTTYAKVTSYTEKFPQIVEPEGWSLLEIDFECLQKSSILKMDTAYEKLEKFVLHKLQKLDSDTLFDDFHLKPQSVRSAFIFLSLSQLFPVSTVATHQKKSWRPSRQEMRDSFLLQVNSYGDLKTQLEIRQKKLQQFNVTAQPLAVIIKETAKNNAVKYKCLVKFDNIEYSGLESPLKAVDLAFKSYHALHACYPAESEAMWFFLQKAIYQFTTKWDKHFDIEEILAREFQKFQI
ncbi:Activator of stress genes 1 [Frankliniella fusca]|uniref:Activator of stress genes 1 n=1 Tax=Frankliniella fusca TaxID=407009 RepID=A0AAE1GP78_9NEOP|nr:Activator of stress genes 1 [Frankliniella fusca]